MAAAHNIFWGKIAPCDHFIQLFETKNYLLLSLENYVSTGIAKGDGVIVIATAEHINALEKKLSANYNLEQLVSEQRYMSIDVELRLEELSVDGNIDKALFMESTGGLLRGIKPLEGKMVTVYSELVALLWGIGSRKGVYELERCWHNFCASAGLNMYCAYPGRGFTQDAVDSIKHISSCHKRLIEGNEFTPRLDLYGKNIQPLN